MPTEPNFSKTTQQAALTRQQILLLDFTLNDSVPLCVINISYRNVLILKRPAVVQKLLHRKVTRNPFWVALDVSEVSHLYIRVPQLNG